MRVFVTGATGFVGSAVVRNLLNAGHQVLGLTRSDAGAQALAAAGADAHRGDIDDLESLRRGAVVSDGIIHTAFNHDFSKFAASCEADRHIIEAMGATLVGSDRPFLITSGTAIVRAAPGQPALEKDPIVSASIVPRAATEEAARSLIDRGVNVSVIRLPQVHDPVKQGLITELVRMAREKKSSAYIGNGQNVWSAAHVLDVARLYVLALERREAGSVYHAVAEEGIPLRTIAETLARGLHVPAFSVSMEDAPAHFGWLAGFAGHDLRASGEQTQRRLGWKPTGPGLIADLEQMRYSE